MIYYIGGFPPPYGGVTVKNELLFSELQNRLGNQIIKLDTQRAKRNPFRFVVQGIVMLLNRKAPVIVATAGKQRRNITLLLYSLNRNVLKKSYLVVMGGHFAHRIKDDPVYIRSLGRYRCIFVETKGMAQEMKKLGLGNVAVYPNCRKRSELKMKVRDNADGRLRCVFFSLIQKMKGVDTILEAAGQLPEVDFTFYGHIDPEYETEFGQAAASLPNVRYLGVFQGSNDAVYAELSQYDILLLPTRWKTEGVPGVLVEAKIAAVPAIVSDTCYNAEIVRDGVSGIVLKENSARELVAVIADLNTNRGLLNRLKEGALGSAEAYFAENYIDEIADKLGDKR